MNELVPPQMSFAPYEKRSLHRFETLFVKGWQIKVYGLSAREKPTVSSLQKKLMKRAPEWINDISDEFPVYKAAFAVLHEAKDGDFILFFWWTGENMLASRVFHAPDRQSPFNDIKDTYITACVWELEVVKFERDLWVKCILTGEPDFNCYLTEHLVAPYV